MSTLTERTVTIVQTHGVKALNLPESTKERVFIPALERYLNDPLDYLTVIRNREDDLIEVINGDDELIDTATNQEYQGITEAVWLIFDDYGMNSREGFVATFLLPEEY